jgi:hypothetical protein
MKKGLMILKFRKNMINTKLLVILMLAIIFTPLQVYGVEHSSSVETEDLLPEYNNYHWTYTGSVEYGHDMAIENIIVNQASTQYIVNGSVHDMSDGESDNDFSINLEYIVESDVITQNKDEEVMLDSKYDEIELIRTPLEEGTTWNQTVENPNGEMTTLESTITMVENKDNNLVFTIRYEDTNSDYYEERKIEEGVGVTYFEKLMFNEGDSYVMGYSLYEEASGLTLDSTFQDVSEDDWYKNYVSKLITLELIDGYPDQTFKPDSEITVAEFLKVTVESLSYYPEETSGEWYDPYVSKAIELELIGEEEFEDYNRPINRKEMTKIIVNALGEEPQSGELNFSDAAEIESDYAPYIYTAVELGIISGYPSDNTFRADQNSTRAEASKLFVLMVEEMIEIEAFNTESALNLETEFRDRLFQATEGDSWVVKDFDSIENVIDHVAEITDREIAETYVNNYYQYMDGELTLPPKDGPTRIIEDREYQLEIVHPRAYRLTQETTTEVVGHYTITITYHYRDGNWMMAERNVEVHDNN